MAFTARTSAPSTRDVYKRQTLNSDYNFTDVTTKKYRYQAVYDLKYYEEQEV